MTDTPTTSVGMRQQSLGSNTNTWGDTKLNINLVQADRAIAGYDSTTLPGDTTWTWTSYTSNVGQTPNVVLAGSLSSAATLTVPSVPWSWDSVTNNTGVQITMKTSGGTGVAIPTGAKVAIYNNGTDCVLRSPTYVGTGYTVTNNGDATNKAYVDTAIATASLPATAGTVLVSGSDTTAQYLYAAFTTPASSGIAFSIANAGGNEQLAVTLDVNSRLTASTNVASTDKFPFYDATAGAMRSQERSYVTGKFGLVIQASSASQTVTAGNIYPLDCTSGTGTATWPASATLGDVFGLLIFGTSGWSVNTNSLKYYGTAYSAFTGSDEGLQLFMYSGAARGWIDI